MASATMGALSFLGPIFESLINLRFVREANKIQQERADTAIERIGPSEQYQTRGFDDVYDPYSFESLNRSVQSIIDRGKTDASVLARNVGDYFNDPSVAAFKRKGLIDIGTASKARLGQAMEGTGAQQLGMGRSLSEIGSMEDLMGMQEAEARSGQVAGVEASAEDFTNRTNLARSSAMAQARLTGEGLENELTKLAAGSRMNIGLSEQDANLRAALGASATDQANMDRILNAELSKAGIYTGVPYALPVFSGISSGLDKLHSWQAISKPPKSSSGFSASILGTGGGYQGGCIDGDSMVFTPGGGKPLSLVHPDDRILGADGNFHKVVAKDYGFVEESERVPLVRIAAGPAIVATVDHIIEGRPAGDYKPGDVITVDGEIRTVEDVRPVQYKMCGDLVLEGNVAYVANGFIVESQIGKDIASFSRRIIDRNAECLVPLQRHGDLLFSIQNVGGSWARLAPTPNKNEVSNDVEGSRSARTC